MKGDFSRLTFDAARHLTGVRMQQGRVQLDADWNEQADIARHRVEKETVDALGGCGGPLHHAAFQVRRTGAAGGDFGLSRGRYYVHGVLCECEEAVRYRAQPDLPDVDPLGDGWHLVYLDVWERHLTALDDPSLRETALGGPDTASRTRTVWQVRTVPLDPPGTPAGWQCRDDHAEERFGGATAPSTGRLRARARRTAVESGPCALPPGAGYVGLENRLYRVEIHTRGKDVAADEAGMQVTDANLLAGTLTVSGGPWQAGNAVELFVPGAADPMQGAVAFVTQASPSGGRWELTLNASLPRLAGPGGLRARRPDAIWKMSRDNGIVVAGVQAVDPARREVRLASLGPDEFLDFKPGDWVELTDDGLELKGLPGPLAQVQARIPATRTLVLHTAPAFTFDPDRRPRLRRWDALGAVKSAAGAPAYAALEHGVEVAFEAGSYRTGDYWLIPARTATAELQGGAVEWPREPGGEAMAREAFGIRHRYARLALVQVTGGVVEPRRDCRCLFAPATELNSLVYVAGAGQEAMPDLVANDHLVPLGQPLIVGIANGQCRREVRVRFGVVTGQGELSATGTGGWGAGPLDVPLDPDGFARCWWRLRWRRADPAGSQHQLAEARLLEDGIPVQLPIGFNASLSVAREVAYDPGGCGNLAATRTVQQAIDRLAELPRLSPVSGDAQELMPQEVATRMQPLEVLAASACGPLGGRTVRFHVRSGNGSFSGGGTRLDVTTSSAGRAQARWTPDGVTHYQEVEAELLAGPDGLLGDPSRTRFTFTLSTADQVAYAPGGCGALQGQETVQAAIARLADLAELRIAGGDGQQAGPGRTLEPLRVQVSRACGPVASQAGMVRFRVVSGGGDFAGGGTDRTVNTDPQGFAQVDWRPDLTTPFQEVEATLVRTTGQPVGQPDTVRFGATQAPRPGGGCSGISLSPDEDWRARLEDYLQGREYADVCFRAGTFTLDRPMVFERLAGVKVSGAGAATRLVAVASEQALRFEGCGRVEVRSLYAESRVAGSRGERQGLNGTLTMAACADVDVDSVVLRCWWAPRRASACLRVQGTLPGWWIPSERRPVVRVRNCDAQMGANQVGMLFTDPDVLLVENNTVRVWGEPWNFDLERALQDPGYSAGVLRLLRSTANLRGDFAGARLGMLSGAAAGPASGTLGVMLRSFAAPSALAMRSLAFGDEVTVRGGEATLVGDDVAVPGGPGETPIDREAVGGLPIDTGRLPVIDNLPKVEQPVTVAVHAIPRFWRRWLGWMETVAYQGIVVGGSSAREVRILNNTVDGALMGVHVGISNADRAGFESAGNVTVSGNVVDIRLPFAVTGQRHGIFVGNCNVLHLENNAVNVFRGNWWEWREIEGIKLFGYFGPKLVAQDNQVANCTVGFLVMPLNYEGSQRLWRVVHNVVEGAWSPISIPPDRAGTVDTTGNVAL